MIRIGDAGIHFVIPVTTLVSSSPTSRLARTWAVV